MLGPLTGTLVITQLFGSMRGGAAEAYAVTHDGVTFRTCGHVGVDLVAAEGTPVYAMKAGTIRYYGTAWGAPADDGYGPLGLHAVVTLPSGEQHWYAHLSTMIAPDGATVFGGQEIALSGATGNVTAAHLHAAVRPANCSYGNKYDGFEDFLTHFDATVAIDASHV